MSLHFLGHSKIVAYISKSLEILIVQEKNKS